MKRKVAGILLGMLSLGGVLAQGDEELLEPDKAFAFSAAATAADEVSFTWKIADDYYMYRDKFSARVVEGDAVLGELVLPVGKKKADEFFGEQEIYVGTMVMHAPIEREGQAGPLALTVEAIGQGCNEPVGVCYPPIKQTATLQLAALTQTSPPDAAMGAEAAVPPVGQSSGVTSLQTLKDLLGTGQVQQEFLDPDQAFKFDLYARDARNLAARFEIAEGYYLYRDKVSFQSRTDGVTLADYQMPPGVEKEDEYFGKMIIYHDRFDVHLPLLSRADKIEQADFKVTYQGCAEKGICYPPITKNVALNLLPVSAAQAATDAPAEAGTAWVTLSPGFWGYIAGAFGVGLLLTFTPCVLPLIPIMSSFIVGQSSINRSRGGTLSLVYVLGTAVTYTVAGVVAGASGEQLQAYFQNIWFVGFVSILLMVLALSMFGLYDIQMPSAVQSRLQQKSQGMGGGRFTMVFILGIISALIVGACVSPLLIGALGVAIVKGDPLLGGAIMFSMALGMGVFLVLLGTGMGALMPRAGPWMDYVKYGFGIVLIGTAIYLLGTVAWIPVLYLWAVLFIVTAVYCGALQPLPQGAAGWRYLSKGFGVVLLVWGVLALLGGMSGNRDILRPLDVAAWGRGQSETGSAHVEFERVSNLDDLDAQLELAQVNARPVMLDYYADWCVDCVRMEKATFSDPGVASVLQDFVLLQVDVTDPADKATKAIKQRYGVYGPPAMLFFDKTGAEQDDLRRYGFMSPTEFLSHVAKL